MAKQADLTKMNKGDLADFLAKKLTKEDLRTVAEHVQNGTFNAEMLRGGVAPQQPQAGDPNAVAGGALSTDQGVVAGSTGEGVTPQDTTGNLGDGEGNSY